jgi:hypothetical protein
MRLVDVVKIRFELEDRKVLRIRWMMQVCTIAGCSRLASAPRTRTSRVLDLLSHQPPRGPNACHLSAE